MGQPEDLAPTRVYLNPNDAVKDKQRRRDRTGVQDLPQLTTAMAGCAEVD